MRTYPLSLAVLSAWACACTAPAEPSGDESASSESSAMQDTLEQRRSPVFPAAAHPFGHDMVDWSRRWWKWVYGIPAESNPWFDSAGADCAIDQSGPVWFLASVSAPGGVATITRSCTLPEGKAIFVALEGLLNDYPCPDPSFKPAPGQSLYDFLRDGAAQTVESVNGLSLTVDGQNAADPFSYRFTSPHLFHITGDPSLTAKLDGCITGSSQPAVSDGHFMMVKPLEAGNHTLIVHSTDPHNDVTVVWNLTVTECR